MVRLRGSGFAGLGWWFWWVLCSCGVKRLVLLGCFFLFLFFSKSFGFLFFWGSFDFFFVFLAPHTLILGGGFGGVLPMGFNGLALFSWFWRVVYLSCVHADEQVMPLFLSLFLSRSSWICFSFHNCLLDFELRAFLVLSKKKKHFYLFRWIWHFAMLCNVFFGLAFWGSEFHFGEGEKLQSWSAILSESVPHSCHMLQFFLSPELTLFFLSFLAVGNFGTILCAVKMCRHFTVNLPNPGPQC